MPYECLVEDDNKAMGIQLTFLDNHGEQKKHDQQLNYGKMLPVLRKLEFINSMNPCCLGPTLGC